MKMTTARHTVLARLSDGNWERGHDLAAEVAKELDLTAHTISEHVEDIRAEWAATVLSALHLSGMIRDDMSGGAVQDRMWTLTPLGYRALKGANQ